MIGRQLSYLSSARGQAYGHKKPRAECILTLRPQLERAAGDRNAAFTRQKRRKRPQGATSLLPRKRSVPVAMVVVSSCTPRAWRAAGFDTINQNPTCQFMNS